MWVAHIDLKTCLFCFTQNGTVIPIEENTDQLIPAHPFCRCETETLSSIKAGEATQDGTNGADYWLMYYKRLPDYYASRTDFYAAGWKKGKPPRKYLPGKMIFGGVFDNADGKLPVKLGRTWYEADINYYEGMRNGHRIYYSSDGLVFVSYNHGESFLK